MTNNVITSIDQISVQWLTSVLTKRGALTDGVVESFELGTGQGNWSTSANLLVKYSVDAKGQLPERLFLKMVDTDTGDGEFFTDSEVNFYTRDYVDVENAPLLRWYDAEYSAELNRYHILLEDVSDTHIKAGDKEPTLEYGLALAEGLAILHARWWGAQRLAEAGAPVHDAAHIQNFVDIAEPGVEHIWNRFSDELNPHWHDLMRELFAKHPQAMIRRAQDLNGFTIFHGDVGDGNILVPREGDGPIYIIDRQPFDWGLTTWLGVYDLAYAIVLDWDIDMRRQCEIPMLKRYHETLVKNGVPDYSWEQLYDDYKLCVGMCIYIATEYCCGGCGTSERWVSIWLPMMQRALTACDDLDCASIWRRSSS
ncbi:MAG: hypothetical protein QY332_04235 [Anaerolineales bacterium]|nr:MAG: hypothetical protein QY332_04235 [Anaerolineales bacterium]